MLLAAKPDSTSPSIASANNEPAEGLNRSDYRQLTSTGGQVVSLGLENWGWSDQIAQWSREEQDLLNSSWRTSTLTTYNAPIKRWLAWCGIYKVNPKRPNGHQVARL